ncbi:MAG: TolC family protein [Calditrichaceae bacterium]|nr:TolC family protein [Calditrichaceae bacterium]MBN2708737.1 TolC family protein [Calditrichaceae bacterium]
MVINCINRILFSISMLACILIFLPFTLNGQENETYYFNIDDAILRALEQNNQIKAGEYGIQKAKWDKRRAQTALLPTVTFNTRYTWIDDETYALRDFSRYFRDGGMDSTMPGMNFDIPQTVFQNSFVTSLDVNMTLFNWMVINGLSIASATENAAKYQSNSTRDRILFEIIAGYMNVLYNQEILALQTDYLGLSKLNYDKAVRMQEAGRYSKVEALRWKVDYQQQLSLVENGKSQLRSAKAILRRMLNIPMNALIQVDLQIPDRFITESEKIKLMTAENIIDTINVDDEKLIEINAALKAMESNTEISKLLYKNTYEKFAPTISLNYQYAWRENNTIELDDYSPQTLMINFSFPLFSSFQDYSHLKSSYYEYRQNKELFEDQLKNTRYILTETVNKIINLRTQIELSKTNIEYNEHNYRIVEQQHEKGLISNIDFIDAKLNLQNAKLSDVRNNYDFISAILELYYLLGDLERFIPDYLSKN